MRELLWPAFRDGDLSLNPQTFVHNSVDVEHLRGGGDPHAAWNLGELAGLARPVQPAAARLRLGGGRGAVLLLL